METSFDSNIFDLRLSDTTALYQTLNKNADTNLTFEELVASLTPAKKQLVLSAIELYKREQFKSFDKIQSSRDAYNIVYDVLQDLVHEELWCLYLNQSNKVIKRVRISMGAISETAVDIRLILKNAIMLDTSAIIIAHNHPSGNTIPSSADDAFTKKLKEASRLHDIRILDHIIVANKTNSYFSYADEGKI